MSASSMWRVAGRKIVSGAFAALLATRSSLLALEVTPVYDARFFGGQHFFDGDVSAVSGNARVMVSPAMKFNEKWSFIPTYTGGYQGTRDVQELAGGGTLFQDSTNHGITLKGIYTVVPVLKLKTTIGAGTNLLRETKDEKWGKGLFDNRKYSGGLETEYNHSEQAGGRAAYDYFMLDFPNYRSLESSQDSNLSRELAGKDTLNSGNHLFTVGAWSPVPGGVRLDLGLFYNIRHFSDQPEIISSGDLTGTDRRDNVIAVSLGVSRPLSFGQNLKLVSELGVGYNKADSNQNHYDARKTFFIKDYYDYSGVTVAPQLTLGVGSRPWIFNLSAAYTRRKYDERPIQDSDGNYLTEKTNITDISTSLGVTYPFTKNFRFRAVSMLGWSDSNMKYEKVFRYNYKIANYLFGFSYEY